MGGVIFECGVGFGYGVGDVFVYVKECWRWGGGMKGVVYVFWGVGKLVDCREWGRWR